MLFMDSTPDYAAINEAVNLVQKWVQKQVSHKRHPSKSSARHRTASKPQFKDRTKLVATTFSHPEWLVSRWSSRFGEREAFQLMQANNTRPSYYVRANTMPTLTNFELRMKKLV